MLRVLGIKSGDMGPAGMILNRESAVLPHGETVVRKVVPREYDLELVYRGRGFPDYLGCLDGPVWSGRVVEAFRRAGLCCAEFFPLWIVKSEDRRLLELPSPNYHLVKAISCVPAEMLMPDRLTPYVKDVNSGLYEGYKPGYVRIDLSRWKDFDLAYLSTLYSNWLFCNERFKAFIEKNGFTNFWFMEAENGNEFHHN